ncbi:hypothetical protein BDV93DRAFT_168190 [Ceratobasidium sp. AG-I]|nr:hypothetical protein BDV93DRAFT_168190 [Ceratobasidium sp. AG-I]
MSSQPSSSMSTIPSTPTMVRQQYQQSQDPFSSPARGVGWSPSASIPLLDVLFREEEGSTPSRDAQSASDLGAFRASRVVWPVPNSRDEDASALVSPPKNASASSSQSRQAPSPEDMTRFLVSPRSGPPSSPSPSRFPETSHSTTHSLYAYSSPVASASQSPSARITWYAAGLDDDRQDQYQWASPASGGLGYPNYYPTFHSSYLETYSPSSQAYLSPSQVFPSPSASFLSPSRAFISPSAAFPSPSPMYASSVRSSSPFFPPPASPPPFAMHLAGGAHTSSNSGDIRTPESTHDDSDSPQIMNAPPSSPAIPPSSLVLPPSSPVLSPPSSAPLVDDPFLVSRKTHVYTRVPRPTRGKTGLVDVQAGITKPLRAKAKTATRGRRVIPSLERSAPGESSSLSSLGEASYATSWGQAASALPTPAKFATAARGSLQPPLTTPGSLSAPRVTSTATYSGNVCVNPSTSFTPSFSTPASNTSFMFPTPTSTIALATPAHPGLLSSPEIADPFSTPRTSSGITRGRGRGEERVKRVREVKRDGTPTPVGVSGDLWNIGREGGVEVDPKREVDSMGASGTDDGNSGDAQGSHLASEQLAVSILNEEPAGPKTWIVPKNELVAGSLSSKDSLGLRESVKVTGPSGQAGFASAAVSKDGPGVASPQDSSSSIKRGKRVLDEDGDEYDPVKKIKTDEENVSRDRVGNRVRRNVRVPRFPVARPTRSHARAVAALLVPEASTNLDALDHKICPSFVDAGQAESNAAPSLTPPHAQPTIIYNQLEAPNSKRTREKRPGTVDRVVLGRAPSRATSEVQASKPHQRSVGLQPEGGSAIRRTRPIDMGNEDDEGFATQEDDEAEGKTQSEAEGSYSPTPPRANTKSRLICYPDLMPV